MLLRFCSVLNHKVGLTAVIYLAGYPAFLQPRCQERQSPGYLRKIWLCFFPSPAPIQGMLGLEGWTYIINTLEKFGAVAPVVFSVTGPVWVFPDPFHQHGRWGSKEGKIMASLMKMPYICRVKCLCDFCQCLLLRDWESKGAFSEKKCIACYVTTRVISGSGFGFFPLCGIEVRSSAFTEQSPDASSTGAGPAPPQFGHRWEGATVFQTARDTGSSHRCRLVSTLGARFFPLPPLLRDSVLVFVRWSPRAVSTYYSLIADF